MDQFVNAGFLIRPEQGEHGLLGLRKSERGENAGRVRSRGAVRGREQILELAQHILHALAKLRALLDQLMTAFAARGIDPAGNGENLPAVFGGRGIHDHLIFPDGFDGGLEAHPIRLHGRIDVGWQAIERHSHFPHPAPTGACRIPIDELHGG